MQDSITIADVGSMVKVSGSRIATPFGPPRPGSTPTNMPSTSPSIISDSVFTVSSTPKPRNRSSSASMALGSEPGLERAFGHDHIEGDVEGDEHRRGEDERRQHRLPPGDAPDDAHESGDEQEARDVDAQPLREEAEQERRHQHLHHPLELVAVDEGFVLAAMQYGFHQAEEARRAEEQRQVEREVAGLGTVRSPASAAPPVVPRHQRRES